MMDTCDEEAHVLDRFALHFGPRPFDLSSDSSLHHGQAPSDNDFVGADSLSLDHHHPYYNDPNLGSNILDVSNSVMFDSTFSSINLTTESVTEFGNGAVTTSAASVIDAVAVGAVDGAGNETRLFETERQNLSNSTSPNDDKKSCTCKDCGKVFNSVWYLKQHAVKHSSERPFKCKYCHKTYRFRSNLYQHKCPLRDRASELASAAALSNGDGSRKVSSTAADSPHPSSESSSSAEVAAGGAPRQRKRRAWPPLTSPPTSAASSMVNGGEKQSKTKGRKGNPFVPESMMEVNNNNNHSSIDSPSSPSSGQLAASSKRPPAAVLSEEEVQKFLDRHKDKLHKCPKCKSLWPSREYLTRHMEWHNDDSSRVRCVHCSETFVDEHRYGLHKQNHSPSSLHVCQRCRGKFSTRVALKKHARRCSMADSKTNGAASKNGYRQALFIDPTPPPSPAPAPKEAENEMQLASAQQTWPSSSWEDGSGPKLDSGTGLVVANGDGREKMANGGAPAANGVMASSAGANGGLPLSNVPQNNLFHVAVVDAHSGWQAGPHWLSEHNLAHNGDVHLQMERPYFYHAQSESGHVIKASSPAATPPGPLGLQSAALEQVTVGADGRLVEAVDGWADKVWARVDRLKPGVVVQAPVPLVAGEAEPKAAVVQGAQGMQPGPVGGQPRLVCRACGCRLLSEHEHAAECKAEDGGEQGSDVASGSDTVETEASEEDGQGTSE